MRTYEVWHFYAYKKIASKQIVFRELKMYDDTKTIDDITTKYLHRSTYRRLLRNDLVDYIVIGEKRKLYRFTNRRGLFGIPVWYCKRIVYGEELTAQKEAQEA